MSTDVAEIVRFHGAQTRIKAGFSIACLGDFAFPCRHPAVETGKVFVDFAVARIPQGRYCVWLIIRDRGNRFAGQSHVDVL